eukprot:4306652-Pleurochrysis_carterae.AAC.5
MANSMIHQAGHSQSADEGRRQPFGGLSMTLPPKSSMQNPEQIPSIASWSPLQSNRARYATHIHLARQSCPEARRSQTASRPEAPSPWPEAQLPPPRVPQWPPTSPWQPATRESAFSMQVCSRSRQAVWTLNFTNEVNACESSAALGPLPLTVRCFSSRRYSCGQHLRLRDTGSGVSGLGKAFLRFFRSLLYEAHTLLSVSEAPVCNWLTEQDATRGNRA